MPSPLRETLGYKDCNHEGNSNESQTNHYDLASLWLCLLLPVVVQAQAPSPRHASPVRSLSDNIAALSQRAGSLLPYFNNEIVSKLIGWFELLAWVFGNCLAGFAMLRIVREDNGEGSNLYWWFGRLGLFFMLSGTSLAIINGMSAIGYEIANGNETRTTISSASSFIWPSVTVSTTPMRSFSRTCSR